MRATISELVVHRLFDLAVALLRKVLARVPH